MIFTLFAPSLAGRSVPRGGSRDAFGNTDRLGGRRMAGPRFFLVTMDKTCPMTGPEMTYTCPHCGGTGVAPAHWPQAIRALDQKGRFTIPWPAAARRYRVELRGHVVWFVADQEGLVAPVAVNDGCERLTIPAEFRQVLALRPGDDVALSRDRRDLLVWAWREAGNG